MNKMRYTEWIDEYVDGELDEARRLEFENALTFNKDLAFEYKLEQDLQFALGQEDLLDLRAKCFTAQQEFNIENKKLARVVQITRKYWYAAASVFLIALIAGGLLLMNPGSYSPEKLFRMYYKSGETLGVSRSGNDNMVEALRYFSRNDFQTADRLFDGILANDPENYAVMYYSGISNIETKNYPKAILMFEAIVENQNNLYTENAEWYLGLSRLAAGQIREAEQEFRIIALNPAHFYSKDAMSILEKINKSEKNKKFLNNLFFLILPF